MEPPLTPEYAKRRPCPAGMDGDGFMKAARSAENYNSESNVASCALSSSLWV